MRVTLLLLVFTGCAGLSPARRAALEADAAPALVALQAARFEEAQNLAAASLQRDPENSRAAGISAVALYRLAVHDVVSDALTMAASFVTATVLRTNIINQGFLDFALTRADERLQAIDTHLATAQKDPGFSLELCPACWEVDWNRSGEVDAFDRHLLEIELDGNGQPLAEDDPRRRPTFRFDVADVAWLRAMVSFQRAALALAGAYDLNFTFAAQQRRQFALKVRDPAKLLATRDFALAGLAHAETCRQLVLTESDDDREWLPNPKQQHHALPLPVDDALFATWGGVLTDLGRLLRGEEGLSVAALAQLGEKWDPPPGGFIDLGALFAAPHDFSVGREELRGLKHRDAGATSELLGKIFGPAYKAKLAPSPLIDRLERMRREVKRGEETFERKVKYLIWLN